MRFCYIIFFIVAVHITSTSAQNVSVGYDKGVDFSRYASYTWSAPAAPPSRPLLYAAMVHSVDNQLKLKGLVRQERDGDLTLIPTGGMEFGFNTGVGAPLVPSYTTPPPAMDATMWTGAGGTSSQMAPYVPEGTLSLSFVDRTANRVVWTGAVKLKLDIEHKQKSLSLAEKAITKLLRDFPPAKK